MFFISSDLWKSVEKILEELCEEEKKFKEEKEKREELKLQEWRKKVKEKDKR